MALSRENSKRARTRSGHRRRGRRRYNVVWRCSGGVLAVASFSPPVRRDAHQTVSHLSPRRASVAVPDKAECFAWLRPRQSVSQTLLLPCARIGRFFHPQKSPRDQFVALFGHFVAFFVIFIGMGCGMATKAPFFPFFGPHVDGPARGKARTASASNPTNQIRKPSYEKNPTHACPHGRNYFLRAERDGGAHLQRDSWLCPFWKCVLRAVQHSSESQFHWWRIHSIATSCLLNSGAVRTSHVHSEQIQSFFIRRQSFQNRLL